MEQRGVYYDTAGAPRYMIPNHTLQLVAMTAMEPPISFHSEAVRNEKANVLLAIPPLNPPIPVLPVIAAKSPKPAVDCVSGGIRRVTA